MPGSRGVRSMAVRNVYLLKRYREEIPSDTTFYGKQRSILALPEGFGQDPALLAEIRTTLSHIFRFTLEEPSSAVVRREMQGTKDQLGHAIRDHALGTIEELRQTYLQIAEEFLTLLVELGGGYTAEQAQKERSSFGSWSEVRWLQTDLRELIVIAVEAGNTDVVGTIGFLPFAIAIRAIQVCDHFLFQQFLQFATFFYFLAADQLPDLRLRGFLTDRSWRWPKEIVDIYVTPDLSSKAASRDDLLATRDFATNTQRVFQDVLKSMADKRDVAAFTSVANEFKRLFRGFLERNDPHNAALIRIQLEHVVDATQRADLEARVAVETVREETATALRTNTSMIFLALYSRVFAQHLENPLDQALQQLLQQIRSGLPSALEELTAAYAEASNGRTADLWGWDEWDLVADGEAHFIDSHTKLNQSFAVLALEKMAALPPAGRNQVVLPSSHSLADMVREGNQQGLLATLSRMEEDPQRFEAVLSEDARACIGVFRERLVDVRMREQERDEERTRNAALDNDKLTQFREGVQRHFAESRKLHAILSEAGAVEERLTENPGAAIPAMGYNQLDNKGAFIAQENTSYLDWDRAYGEGLAQSEDEAAFQTIIGGAGQTEDVVPGRLIEAVSAATDGLDEPIMLQSLEFEAEYAELHQSPAFMARHIPELRSKWMSFRGFMGVMTHRDSRQISNFRRLCAAA